MYLNEFGKVVREEWLKTFDMRKNLVLDEYIVMPNHFHGIIIIESRGILQYAQLSTLQRAPTGGNRLGRLEEEIYGGTKKNNRKIASPQSLNAYIKGISDIMRRSGRAGTLQFVPTLVIA